MHIYKLTILEKDMFHIPNVNRLAQKLESNYSTTSSEGKVIYELNFPTYEHMDAFIQEIIKLKLI